MRSVRNEPLARRSYVDIHIKYNESIYKCTIGTDAFTIKNNVGNHFTITPQNGALRRSFMAHIDVHKLFQ